MTAGHPLVVPCYLKAIMAMVTSSIMCVRMCGNRKWFFCGSWTPFMADRTAMHRESWWIWKVYVSIYVSYWHCVVSEFTLSMIWFTITPYMLKWVNLHYLAPLCSHCRPECAVHMYVLSTCETQVWGTACATWNVEIRLTRATSIQVSRSHLSAMQWQCDQGRQNIQSEENRNLSLGPYIFS